MKSSPDKSILPNINIAFIVTRGRSGSTLLQTTLDAHPNICAPNESDFVLYLKSKYYSTTNWNNSTIKKFINDLYTNRKYRLFWKVKKETIEALFRKYHVRNYSDACKIVYLSANSPFEKKEIKIIIDKNPFHSQHIKQLQDIFIDAKFIHLIRDPRAVTNSVQQSFNKKNVTRISKSWVNANKKIESLKNNNTFTTIHYESLTSKPKETLTATLKFLNLPYYDSLLNSYQTIEKIKSSHANFSLSHHKNIGSKISTSFVEKWKKQLTPSEIKIINYITAETGSYYGYKIEISKLNSLEKKQLSKQSKKTVFRHKRAIYYKLPLYFRKSILFIISVISDRKYRS